MHWFRQGLNRLMNLFAAYAPRNSSHVQGLVKILIEPSIKPSPVVAETVWAKSMGDQLYQIENIPVFSSHYHFHDIVACEDVGDGSLIVRELRQSSGNKTLRIQLARELGKATYSRLTNELGQLGVDWVIGFTGACAFNISPRVDEGNVRELLLSKIGEKKFYFVRE